MSEWDFGTYTMALANAYFATHPENHLWADFSDTLKTNAVAEAERMIWAYLGGYHDLVHPSDILTSSRIRHDYAVYEQALFLLQRSGAIANGEETTPKYMANNEDADAVAKSTEEAFPVLIAPRAKFWLGQNLYNPRINRG